MKSYPYIPSMVQAITVLTVLKMMTKAQTSCGSGSMNGKIYYERLPNVQLEGFDDDIVRDSAQPFMVLEKCQDLCLRDRSSTNIVRTCRSFDFQPAGRISSYNGGAEYDPSICLLSGEQARPEGMGNLMVVPESVHFNEICLTSNKPREECPNRKYVFERYPGKRLNLSHSDVKQMPVTNRTDCEDKCLNEYRFVCRSASYDSVAGNCILSRYTRRTYPELLLTDVNSDYLENTCLKAERRCDGLPVFIKEENKRISWPFEVDFFTNLTLEECQAMCVHGEKYFCRSIEYDTVTKQCSIFEEDSISQTEVTTSSSRSHHFYDLACLDSPRSNEYPDNSGKTSHLFTDKKPDTAFQRYRNSRLSGDHQSELSGLSLNECLDECLRQPSFKCKSAEYSERQKSCRLSQYNKDDQGMRIVYDADVDYYENLMLGGDEIPSIRPERPGFPGPGGTRHPGSPYRPDNTDSGYDRDPNYWERPYDRYPDDYYGGEKRPIYKPIGPPGGRPEDRYPERNPEDRIPPRYPQPSHYPERYPSKFPEEYPERYPSRFPEKYPERYPSRFPEKYPERYPSRFPEEYPERYPSRLPEQYPERYPSKFPEGYPERYPSNNFHPYPHYPPSSTGSQYPKQYPIFIPEKDINENGIRDRRPGDRYGDKFNDNDLRGNRFHTRYRDRWYDPNFDEDKGAANRWWLRPGRPIRPIDGGPLSRPGRPLDGGKLPFDDRPPYRFHRPISPGPDGPIFDGIGETNRPFATRCDEEGSFKLVGIRQRVRKDFIKRSTYASTLIDCERQCTESREFLCRSFNYRELTPAYDSLKNCELSDRDTRELEVNNPQFFETTGNFEFYERSSSGRHGVDEECLDVSQVCNDDGMEFTLRTPEGFYGRIFTNGFYDRCFFRGNGGTINVLRISGSHGYPECGTARFGDTMTNIVVVQFNDHVQTGKDKRFNLTCLFQGPGEAVVSSGYVAAGSGGPVPIEYLPAENTLTSKVRLMILYQGRPTTTIAVGDPLTFRLEAQDGYPYVSDIFATNVMARDPYSGKSIQLIDKFGCPVDTTIFPELDRGRSGDGLEARFNAFKIYESNFLVFEATVRTCREVCPPAYCPSQNPGRSEVSFGRRKRDTNDTQTPGSNVDVSNVGNFTDSSVSFTNTTAATKIHDKSINEEHVKKMIEVLTKEEIQLLAQRSESYAVERAPETVCVTNGEYHGLVAAILFLITIILTLALLFGLAYRRYFGTIRKNNTACRMPSSLSSNYRTATRSSVLSSGISIFGNSVQKPFAGFGKGNIFPGRHRDESLTPAEGPFEDPSEPIYIDPSMFERSRSLRSIAVCPKRKSASP